MEFLSLLFSLKGMSYFGGSSEKDAKNICEMVQRWAENQDEKTKKEFDKLLFNRKFQKK